MSTAIIIILILILIIIIAVFCGIAYASRKVKQFSRQIFGTEHILEGAEQMRQEYATTPKSVSAMTSLLLQNIVSDFPDFQYNEMRDRTNNLLTSFLRAINEKNGGLLQDGNSELKQKLENRILLWTDKDCHEHFEQIRIHRTEINQYRKSAGRCIITFQTALECYHYITDINGKVIEGSKEYKYQTKYNTDLIYIQNRDIVEQETDRALGVNCPNCGAPLNSLGAKVCEYCGSPVIEINIHAWSFSNIEEVR